MIHMIKLVVGLSTLEELAARMHHQTHAGHPVVHTRTMPKRVEEVLDGGSLYRVLDGMILCRQPIVGFDTITRPDGTQGTLILTGPTPIPVRPRPMRAFQGWRYLKPEDAPPDLTPHDITDGADTLPQAMRRELTALGLL